jgi:uncharacterized protein with FMN-binding domain
MNQIESGTVDGGVQPAQGRDGEFRGSAMAEDGYLAIQSTIQRTKNIGMEWETWRAHQSRKRRRSQTGNGVELGIADSGGVVEL